MTHVDDDHVVEEISAAVANPTLCDAVLPRAPEAASLGLDPEAFHCGDHFFIETCTAIEDQIGGSRIEGESLTQLLNDPGGGRMSGHIAVKDLAPVMRNHEEAVQDAEVQRGHCGEIHCGDGFAVIGQKCSPSLCRLRIPRRFSHPSLYSTFRNVEPEHLQFAMNARSTPG